MKEAIAQSSAAAESIEKQVGVKPAVGFRLNNGSLTSVTGQFPKMPEKPMAELEPIVRAAVVTAFKSEQKNLFISFASEKKAP